MSSISPNADFALAIAPVLIIPMMLFGGFYLNTESVVDWLIWIRSDMRHERVVMFPACDWSFVANPAFSLVKNDY